MEKNTIYKPFPQNQWFFDHYKELYKKYGKKSIIVKDEIIYGAYNTRNEALKEALRLFDIGEFQIHDLCENINPNKVMQIYTPFLYWMLNINLRWY